MNNRSLLRALGITALAFAAAAVIAVGAYNAGMAHGIAESGRAITALPPGTPCVYVWPRPWGFGFLPVFPLFFLVFFFFVVRGLLWRAAWRGGWRCGFDRVPPAFDEWHRRAHGERAPSRPSPTSTT
jgi:hypothetical protein